MNKYDYSDFGWYFVTICTKDRLEYFGNIVDDEMVLNKYGEIINKYWSEIPKHFNNVELDEFQIMANHIHGIIVIRNVNQYVGAGFPRPMNQFRPILGQIVGYFKYQSTKYINIFIKGSGNPTPTNKTIIKQIFQRSFYDHIIRNEFDLNRIRQYIRDNPINWDEDRNNSGNLWL
ncbi:MAG: transposase [Patescibacteria group bacterium]